MRKISFNEAVMATLPISKISTDMFIFTSEQTNQEFNDSEKSSSENNQPNDEEQENLRTNREND